jgi:DNA modification methylase
MTTRILTGDCRELLPTLPGGSVQCCVTSPPYFGLRDYGVHGQIGLESTVESFVAEMVGVFREVRRVLADDGTLWLNLGDSYAAGKSGRTDHGSGDPTSRLGPERDGLPGGTPPGPVAYRKPTDGLKPKDLIGIPWRVAFALQSDGWYLRQDIIWAKPNPMPESVRDRCTKSHEYLFMFSKRPRYYFDAAAIAEPVTQSTIERLSQPNLANQNGSDRVPGKTNGAMKAVGGETRNKRSVWTIESTGNRDRECLAIIESDLAPTDKLDAIKSMMGGAQSSVWRIATQPTKQAHFATFPEALVEPCILAGTSERGQCRECGRPWVRVVERETSTPARVGGAKTAGADVHNSSNRPGGFYDSATVTTGWSPSCTCDAGNPVPQTILDPFAGSGTTLGVANRLGRHSVGIELNPEYVPMIERRTAQLALEVA